MLAPHITATCREFFGRVVDRRGKRELVDNRCDKCPLRSPCLTWGGMPARNYEELHKANDWFATEASAVLASLPTAIVRKVPT